MLPAAFSGVTLLHIPFVPNPRPSASRQRRSLPTAHTRHGRGHRRRRHHHHHHRHRRVRYRYRHLRYYYCRLHKNAVTKTCFNMSKHASLPLVILTPWPRNRLPRLQPQETPRTSPLSMPVAPVAGADPHPSPRNGYRRLPSCAPPWGSAIPLQV